MSGDTGAGGSGGPASGVPAGPASGGSGDPGAGGPGGPASGAPGGPAPAGPSAGASPGGRPAASEPPWAAPAAPAASPPTLAFGPPPGPPPGAGPGATPPPERPSAPPAPEAPAGGASTLAFAAASGAGSEGAPAGAGHAGGVPAGAAAGPAPQAGWAGSGTAPPPPGAPPGFGPPPGYGPPGGYGPPPAHGPQPPARPPGDANPAQAAAIALLNLSGLGLGYVLLRQWIGAAVCWLATAALLVGALPADVDGVPPGLLVGYGVVLLAAAADGARRGLRATLRIGDSLRRLALPLALVLLAVPAGGSLAYGSARDEAKEQALLEQLAAADKLVKSADGLAFAKAEPIYRQALTGYEDLGTRYAGSRAGKLVPDRLDAYYKTLSAPYGEKKYCEAIAPLKHLRELPATVDKGLLGARPAKTDEPLAESLYQCGTAALGVQTAEPTASDSLNTLYDTFPKAEQTTRVEPAVREAIKTRTATLSGSEPCPATTQLRALDSSLGNMKDPSLAGAAKEAKEAVQKGDFACGADEFKDKQFSLAASAMTDYAKAYPDSPQAAHARSIAIAAEIAEEEPAAGKALPPADVPGGARMVMVISNDGPGEVEVLYTGPMTGRVTLKACGTCTKYQTPLLVNSPKIKACTGPSSKYPKATLLLPAGDYHFLQKRAATGTSTAGDTKSSRTKIEPGYSYTNCLYVTSLF
ncbi:hypothetical protein ACIQMY_21330 [Streptomyces sp. NPDC091368]|uniref:hypothetical protein n=1 Tax=Streptomyces sp. NPDC091368 TaxID=3365993 RepID=UPI003812A03F